MSRIIDINCEIFNYPLNKIIESEHLKHKEGETKQNSFKKGCQFSWYQGSWTNADSVTFLIEDLAYSHAEVIERKELLCTW